MAGGRWGVIPTENFTPIPADTAPIKGELSRDELDSITYRVIGAAQRVSSELGSGFVEKVYENALVRELHDAGVRAEVQKPVHVFYKGSLVGTFHTDVLVEDAVLVEVKAVGSLVHEHHVQCLNYLRATGFRVCLLMNFGNPHLRFRRIVNEF